MAVSLPIDLMSRDDTDGDGRALQVTMWYHGKDAAPRVTVQLTIRGEGEEPVEVITLDPGEDHVMDAYLHPFTYADCQLAAQHAA